MRVDGVNILIFGLAQLFLDNAELNFTVKVNGSTGEIISQTAKYHGLFITVYPSGNVRMEGSLHKYSNGGEHNYNELSHSDLVSTLHDLKSRFGIDLNTARITRMEFGVNIHPHLPTGDLLKAIILHKTKPFYITRGRDIDFMAAKYEEYKIKAYDKGRQYNTPEDVFRFEIVAVKNWLRKTGIGSLTDLIDPGKYRSLGVIIKEEFEKLFIIDPPDFREMTNRDAFSLKDFQNPKYWEGLNHNYRSRRLNTARKLLEKHNLNTIHKSVGELLMLQISEKQQDKIKPLHVLTGVSEGSVENQTPTRFNHLYNSVENSTSTFSERRCNVTGVDISMQHPSSKHLSPVGLRYLQTHDPESYQDIIHRFGPQGDNLDQATIHYRIAHNIRNFVSNQWRDMRNVETKRQGNYTLFTDCKLYGPRAILALLLSNKNTTQCHLNQG